MNENHKILRFLLYISPFFFPAYFLRFHVFGIPFTALEVFCYVIFAVWIFGISRPKAFWRFSLPALIFLAGISVGIFTGINNTIPGAAQTMLGVFKGWIIAPLLYFFVLLQTLSSPLHVQRVLRSFVYSAVFLSLLSYILGVFSNGITYDFRLSGPYESANQLALYLVPAILLNVVWIFQRQSAIKWRHYLDTATLTILLHAIFFTQSYAAISAVFGSLAIYSGYVLVKHRKKAGRATLGFLALLAVFCLVVFTQTQTSKFKQFLDTENRSSTTVRFEIYRVTWDLAKKNWIFGVGPGLYQQSYQIQAQQTLGRAPMEQNVPHPHNIFFAFWLNAGLLGLLALLSLIFAANRQFSYPLLAFWGIILYGFFDTPFWRNDLAMIFWLIIGAIALLQFYGTHSAKKPTAKTKMRSYRLHQTSVKVRKSRA